MKLGDKLAGMMTDKEKNWVVNVQMLQLQIDDPYTYDFYYTVMNNICLTLNALFVPFNITLLSLGF